MRVCPASSRTWTTALPADAAATYVEPWKAPPPETTEYA
jgi:hypothetical protein